MTGPNFGAPPRKAGLKRTVTKTERKVELEFTPDELALKLGFPIRADLVVRFNGLALERDDKLVLQWSEHDEESCLEDLYVGGDE